MSDKITDLTNETFKSAIASSTTPILVDFWAPWCGPCKAMTPILDEVANEFEGKIKIAKLNVDDAGEVAAEYNIRSIPTMLVFKGGQVADQIFGRVSKAELTAKLAPYA